MRKKLDLQLKSEYHAYCEEFKANPLNRPKSKIFNGSYESEPDAAPLTFNQWSVENDIDWKAMGHAIRHNIKLNQAAFKEMSQFINGDPNQGRINPEFEANASSARKINKLMGHDRDEVLARTIAAEKETTDSMLNKEWKPSDTSKSKMIERSFFKKIIDFFTKPQFAELKSRDWRDHVDWIAKK